MPTHGAYRQLASADVAEHRNQAHTATGDLRLEAPESKCGEREQTHACAPRQKEGAEDWGLTLDGLESRIHS